MCSEFIPAHSLNTILNSGSDIQECQRGVKRVCQGDVKRGEGYHSLALCVRSLALAFFTSLRLLEGRHVRAKGSYPGKPRAIAMCGKYHSQARSPAGGNVPPGGGFLARAQVRSLRAKALRSPVLRAPPSALRLSALRSLCSLGHPPFRGCGSRL